MPLSTIFDLYRRKITAKINTKILLKVALNPLTHEK
jgi:hypothetical protein